MQTILLALIAGLLLIIAVINTLPAATERDFIFFLIMVIPLILIVALVFGAVFFSFAAVLSTLATMHGFSIP